jgi:hypothetical protein
MWALPWPLALIVGFFACIWYICLGVFLVIRAILRAIFPDPDYQDRPWDRGTHW